RAKPLPSPARATQATKCQPNRQFCAYNLGMPAKDAADEIRAIRFCGLGPDLAPRYPTAGGRRAIRRTRGAMTLMNGICRTALAACIAAAAGLAAAGAEAQTQGTIKIGVLHSLAGTMAISETTLKDTILMMVDAQNKKGGLLGKKLEAVVVDPASNW